MSLNRSWTGRWVCFGFLGSLGLCGLVSCDRSQPPKPQPTTTTAAPVVNTSTPAALDSAKPQAIAEAPPRATPSSKPDETAIANLSEEARKVLEITQQAATAAPGSAEKIGRVGMVLLANGLPRQSLEYFEKARTIVPKGMKWRYYPALAYEALGELPKAIQEMRKAVEIDPAYIPARMRLAEMFSEAQSEDAVAEYRGVLREDPDLGIAHLSMGERLLILKRQDEALASLRKAVELEPNFQPARLALISALKNAGKGNEKIPAVRPTSQPQEGPRMVPDPLYVELVRVGRPEEAFMVESFAMARQGQLDAAIHNLSRFWQTHKENMRAANALGILYGMRGEHGAAVEQFKIVIAAQPDFPEVTSNLALALIQLGKHGEAEQVLNKAVQQHPDDARPLEILADMSVQRSDLPAAVERLKSAQRIKPEDAALECALAELLFRQKKDAEALPHIDAALKLAPNFHVALHLRAAARVRARDDASAERDWLTAIQAQPGFIDGYLGLSDIAIRKRDYEAASKYFLDALKLAPDDLQLNNHLAWFRATCPDEKKRDGVDAVARAERICTATDNKNAAFLDTLACALAEVGRYEDAAKKEQMAIQVATDAGQKDLADELSTRLELFERGQPIRFEPDGE